MGSAGMVFQMGFGVLGGLGVFLLGMKNMSEGMQAIAGNRLRKLISLATDNRLVACGVGTLVTSVVQSSSVTTVMVVGFVSAGFMTLIQAIGVIMGANIGTTITSWILVLKIGKFGLPILGVSAFFFLFSRNERVRYAGMAVMGVGMVFFGLELMSSGFKPMRTMPEFVEWFSRFRADTYLGMWKCILCGCLLTAIVQSSSATIGITMGLASSGIIGFESAAALVLGENVGTTITAYLASLGTTTNARRAAYSHIVFNVIGVLWISSVFFPYMRLVRELVGVDPGLMVNDMGEATFPYIRRGIAIVHSGFNIVNTLIFLPLIPLLARIVTRLAPDKPEKEISHLRYLDTRMISSPSIAVQQAQDEMVEMGRHVTKMYSILKEILESKELDDDKIRKVFHREEILDAVQKETTEFLSSMLSGIVPNDVIADARLQLRMADEYESVSDYVAKILKLYLKKKKNDIWFCEEEWKELLVLHDRIAEYVDLVNSAVRENRSEVLTKARTMGQVITTEIKEYRDDHVKRVGSEGSSPLASLIFTDMLNSYRRVKDHCLNIAEAVAGEK